MPVPIFVPNVPQNPPSSVVINSNERLWTSRLKAMSVLTRLTHACRWRIPEITPVFYDRVEDFAVKHIAYTHADTAQMLGHVIAHEIGHLLLNVQTHSASGIMRGRWDLWDVQNAIYGHLLFTRQQAETIRGEVGRQFGK
jgi:hypothetical protein